MNIFRLAREVRLHPEEKAQMRESLVRRMHAARVPRHERGAFLVVFRRHAILAVFLAALFVSGGTSFAAEGALPGDFLYPVKVRINERARTALARTPEAQAALHAELASRRLEEAEQLALDGRLDDEAKTEIESRFEEHAKAAEEHLKELEVGGAIEASNIGTIFEAALETHGKVLDAIAKAEGDGERVRAAQELQETVRKKTSEAKSDRKARNAEVAKDVGRAERAAEGKKKAAVNTVGEVERFLQKTGMESEMIADSLDSARVLIVKGDGAFADQKFEDAFGFYQDAHRRAEEVKQTQQAELRFQVKLERGERRENNPDDDDADDTADEEREKEERRQ